MFCLQVYMCPTEWLVPLEANRGCPIKPQVISKSNKCSKNKATSPAPIDLDFKEKPTQGTI